MTLLHRIKGSVGNAGRGLKNMGSACGSPFKDRQDIVKTTTPTIDSVMNLLHRFKGSVGNAGRGLKNMGSACGSPFKDRQDIVKTTTPTIDSALSSLMPSTKTMVTTGAAVAVGTASAVAGVVAVPKLIYAAGWGRGGVIAGSAAAAIQSAVYGGYTCGVFATLTSIGAAGLSTTGTIAVGTVCGGGGGASTALIVSRWLPKKLHGKKASQKPE